MEEECEELLKEYFRSIKKMTTLDKTLNIEVKASVKRKIRHPLEKI